jgi:hypothetical protein
MKLEQMKTVLEKGGKFEGINRKVQIKPTKWIEQADGAPEVPSDSAARMRGLFHSFSCAVRLLNHRSKHLDSLGPAMGGGHRANQLSAYEMIGSLMCR